MVNVILIMRLSNSYHTGSAPFAAPSVSHLVDIILSDYIVVIDRK